MPARRPAADPAFRETVASSGMQGVYDTLTDRDVAAGTYAVTSAAVFRAHRIVSARVEEVLAPLGLTIPRFEVLGLLNVSEGGRLGFSELKQTMFMHPATMGHTIRQLEGDGLVRRAPDPDDGRAFIAAITAKGRSLSEQAIAALRGIRFGIEGLDEQAARALCVSLGALAE